MKKIISSISNISLVLGIVLGIYALYQSYIIRKDLPPGSCPIAANRIYVYISIIFAIISFILSFVVDYIEKKE